MNRIRKGKDRIIVLLKEDHRYMVRYQEGDDVHAAAAVVRWMDDPDLNLDAKDGWQIVQAITDRGGK